MIKKIKRCFYNFLYSLPFGLKAAEDEMLSQKSSLNSDNVGIHQVIQDNKLIGAVSHVVKSDPSKGYGIYIENMLSITFEENIKRS